MSARNTPTSSDFAELVRTASEEGFTLFQAELRKLRSRSTPAAQIADFAGAYVDFAIKHPAYFRLMFGQGSAPKATTPSLQAAARSVFQGFLMSVRDFLSRDARHSNAHDTALALWSQAHGLAMLALEGQTLFLKVTPGHAPTVARETAQTYLKALAR